MILRFHPPPFLLLMLFAPLAYAFGTAKDLIVSPFSLGNSSDLQDLVPIRSTITQSEIQYFSFSLDLDDGVGEFFENLVFVTGNICTEPEDLSANVYNNLTVYYSFDPTLFDNLEIASMLSFEEGYFQTLATISTDSSSLILYLAVRAPESTNSTATWTYEIAASQNEIVHGWDDDSFVSDVVTDDSSALLMSGDMLKFLSYKSTNANSSVTDTDASGTRLKLYIFSSESEPKLLTLRKSWCGIRNAGALFPTDSFQTNFTYRGEVLRQQYAVKGLNASSTYLGYLTVEDASSQLGGTVYSPVRFTTMASGVCKLIYDLEFCNDVAYAVPALSEDSLLGEDELKLAYDGYAELHYSNFSKAIQQIQCNTSLNYAFSTVLTCKDCELLYKSWLCAVSIPRCTTEYVDGYVLREQGKSRNAFVNDEIVPPLDYYEVLPCIDVCYALVRTCPSQFNFQCPTGSLLLRSYNTFQEGQDPSCNMVGILDEKFLNVSISGHVF